MDFPLRLALDTSTLTQSVAIAREFEVLGEIHLRRPRGRSGGHSASLISAVHSLAEQCGLQLSDMDLFVCGLGPGSFTGLRIGLACLKGLSLTLDTPLAGLSSLEALAESTGVMGLTVPVLDARKKEVYAGAYRAGTAVLSDRAIGPEDLAEVVHRLRQPGEEITFAGQGAHTYESLFAPHGRVLSGLFDAPRASALAWMSHRLCTEDLIVAASVEPNYQRASDAEKNAPKPAP